VNPQACLQATLTDQLNLLPFDEGDFNYSQNTGNSLIG